MELVKGMRLSINIAGIHTVELCEKLGKGGQGHVWKVQDVAREHGEYYVLKHIKIEADNRKENAERIRREARVTADLPHVVRCLGLFELDQDNFALLFPYEPGGDFAAWLKTEGKKTSWPQKKALFLEILRGVQALHDAGIEHRDLKPANILIPTHYREPRIIDFGLAKFRDLPSMTQRGQIFGTPDYWAPEMLEDGAARVDKRYDVYALGVMLHEMIGGQNPWRRWKVNESNVLQIAHDFLRLAKQHQHLLDLAPVTFAEDPSVLEVIRRSTMFDPDQRMERVDKMIEMLGGNSELRRDWTPPKPRPKWPRRAILFGLLLLSAAGGWRLMRPPLPQVTLEYLKLPDKTPFSNGSALRSFEFYKIRLTSSQDAFLYVIQVDSGGVVGRMFPNALSPDNRNPARAGKMYALPSESGAFRLDDHPGTETIYTLAYPQVHDILEGDVSRFSTQEFRRLIYNADGHCSACVDVFRIEHRK